MKTINKTALVAIVAALALTAQVSDFVGAGLGYNQYAAPNVSGHVAYAHLLDAGGKTYSYTVIDASSASRTPFRVQTSTSTGVAQYLKTVGKFDVYGLAAAGVSVGGTATGTNVGAAFTGGGMAVTRIKGSWVLYAPVRYLRVQGANQATIGLGVGWGK
jgi:hypothetical protein